LVNAFNHVHFANPDPPVRASSFGAGGAGWQRPRTIRFELKRTF